MRLAKAEEKSRGISKKKASMITRGHSIKSGDLSLFGLTPIISHEGRDKKIFDCKPQNMPQKGDFKTGGYRLSGLVNRFRENIYSR